ncbi:hypothetical protein [Thermomonospora catenispora]|uniref:hypothetical protein n=1 Tax=Thermomonospora catenispora TaxID=2493090 RepID=UPI00112004A5|nr:hypothetical protein [Thermomonospora catenispora]TNY37752.1 hypothetical protein EIO00_06200 [Thermomonospora catenispora]
MGVQDDFDLWESELQGLLPPSPDPYDDGIPDPSSTPSGPKSTPSADSSGRQDAAGDDSTGRRPGGRCLLVTLAVIAVGCGLLCYLGGWVLAAAVLAVCSLILFLWRIGW